MRLRVTFKNMRFHLSHEQNYRDFYFWNFLPKIITKDKLIKMGKKVTIVKIRPPIAIKKKKKKMFDQPES